MHFLTELTNKTESRSETSSRYEVPIKFRGILHENETLLDGILEIRYGSAV